MCCTILLVCHRISCNVVLKHELGTFVHVIKCCHWMTSCTLYRELISLEHVPAGAMGLPVTSYYSLVMGLPVTSHYSLVIALVHFSVSIWDISTQGHWYFSILFITIMWHLTAGPKLLSRDRNDIKDINNIKDSSDSFDSSDRIDINGSHGYSYISDIYKSIDTSFTSNSSVSTVVRTFLLLWN